MVGLRQWRGRNGPTATTQWMSAIDEFTRVKAFGVGLLLSAVNPKNLTICAVAGTMIGGASGKTVEQVAAIAVFTVIGTSTVAVPVLSYLVARDRLRPSLDGLREWLEQNSRAVVSALFMVIGLVLLAQALIRLAG